MRFKLGYIFLCGVLAAGCNDMWNQPKEKPLAESDFFPDGQSARPLVEGTVPREGLRLDELMFTGRTTETAGGDSAATAGYAGYATVFPMKVDRAVIATGQKAYNIYCSPCHGYTGSGEGMITQRGFKQPPTFHQDRLRQAPPGYFFEVITKGFGTMYSYASRVPVEDRWAITAYIRALQMSRNMTTNDLTAEERRKVEGANQ